MSTVRRVTAYPYEVPDVAVSHEHGLPGFSPSQAATLWSPPIPVDATGIERLDGQNGYPSACFTAERMVVVWSTHVAAPKGSWSAASPEASKIGGGKSAVIKLPE